LGYPAQLNGNVYAGGNVTLGQDLTIGDLAGPVREVVANGSVNVGGGANVYGNVYGNAVSLGSATGIRKAGGIGGNVQHNGSFSLGGGTVEGIVSTPSTQTFTTIVMPSVTSFTAGGANQTVDSGLDVLTLAPGTYGALATSQQDQVINLASGNYYFDSITTQGGFDLQIDLTSGNPASIFVVGNIDMAGRNTLLVKGAGTGGLFKPINEFPSLASLVYFETKARFIMSGGTDSVHNIWGGTAYASALAGGSAEISIGQYTEWYGRIYALDTIDVADHGKWVEPPPGGGDVPEPASLSLLALGGVALVARRR
jgi:hypothetical protein